MTAWIKRGTQEVVGVIVDFTDNSYVCLYRDSTSHFSHTSSSLTEFNKQLIEKYLDIPYVETKCGYACSDQ